MYENLRMADGAEDVIEGWAVPFDGSFNDGRDSYGTKFSARTDFRLDWYAERPLLWHHGLDKDVGLTPVGTVRSMEVRDKGVWMKAQLDAQSEYFEAIRKMVKDGKVFLSSGSVEHLVQINQRTGHVDRWPIVEQTLTTTPSNLLADIPVVNLRSAGVALPEELTDDAVITHTATTHQERLEESAREGFRPPPFDGINGPHTRAADDATVGDMADMDDDEVGSDERSFEDICSDLDALLNPMYANAYTRRLNTFPTHVLVKRCEYGNDGYGPLGDDDEGVTYWDIPYTLGADQEPILGAPVEVQRNESFTPVARAFNLPLTFEAHHLTKHVAAFADSTKDYGERRYREGRMLSAANLQTISDTADGLESHAKSLRTLHERAMARQEEAARAAAYANPEARQWEIDLLELGIA